MNRGKSNTYVNNSFKGLDIGIRDEGEETFAAENEFDSISNQKYKELEKVEEVVKLSPEVYGIGINLKALYKKIKNLFKG